MSCPCGTNFPATMYSVVNVTLEPQLLYQLLAGTLNVAVCPNCGRKASSAQPLLYHDMGRGLFAYVHPEAEVDEEERDALLATLRKVYAHAATEAERVLPPRPTASEDGQPRVRRRTPAEELASIEPEVPPMQVIFGIDGLVALVDSLLEPEARLGRVAFSTRRQDERERERMREIASKMASQLDCLVEIEDNPEEYTAWVYGPRAKIDVLAQALGRA